MSEVSETVTISIERYNKLISTQSRLMASLEKQVAISTWYRDVNENKVVTTVLEYEEAVKYWTSRVDELAKENEKLKLENYTVKQAKEKKWF